MIELTTLTQVARDNTLAKGVFVTCDNRPPCILFKSDLDAIAREVTLSIDLPELQKSQTARTLAKLLLKEALIADGKSLSRAVLGTNAFREANVASYLGEIQFPIKFSFHFAL